MKQISERIKKILASQLYKKSVVDRNILKLLADLNEDHEALVQQVNGLSRMLDKRMKDLEEKNN